MWPQRLLVEVCLPTEGHFLRRSLSPLVHGDVVLFCAVRTLHLIILLSTVILLVLLSVSGSRK